MESRKPALIVFICVFLQAFGAVFAKEPSNKTPEIIFFYSWGCHECAKVRNGLMPWIEKKFKDKINLDYRDINDIENYKLLLSLEEKYQVKIKNVLPVIFFEGRFLSGERKISKKSLEWLIAASLNKPQEKSVSPSIDLIKHFKTFGPLVIIGAGLIDGINPCAFTVMVFFISFLALQGYRRRELITIGLSFIFAVFLTYVLIGLGIFGFIYRMESFWLIRKIFNLSIGVFSIILGILAVYDFLKFKKTHKTEDLVLQLPRAIKKQIHYIIGLHYRKTKESPIGEPVSAKHIFRLIISALITGFLVSIIEAICTGQTYLPAIVFILKTTHLKLQASGYLLVYNLMFTVPLLVIFFFALWGASSEQFSDFLKKRLLTIKILMAILFFSLGIFLIWKA